MIEFAMTIPAEADVTLPIAMNANELLDSALERLSHPTSMATCAIPERTLHELPDVPGGRIYTTPDSCSLFFGDAAQPGYEVLMLMVIDPLTKCDRLREVTHLAFRETGCMVLDVACAVQDSYLQDSLTTCGFKVVQASSRGSLWRLTAKRYAALNAVDPIVKTGRAYPCPAARH